MKPFIFAYIAITLLSCKKETAKDSFNAYIFSNIVTHDVAKKTTYSVDVEMYSECSGEYIHITGEFEMTYHAILKEDGGYHIIAHERALNIRGIGITSAKTYRYLGHFNMQHNYETKGNVYKVTSSGRLVTPGGGNNLVFISTIKYVLDANEELKVVDSTESASCQ
jgi:hypothetical protein